MAQAVMSGMTFAQKVKLLLAQHRMRQTDLAKAVGTHQPQVSKWLNSGVIPSIPLALRVAKALKVSLDYLLDDEEEELPPSAELPKDEANVLSFYRSLKRTGSLGEDEAITGLASAARGQHFGNLGPPRYNDAAMGRAHHDPETGELLDPATGKPRRRRKGS